MIYFNRKSCGRFLCCFFNMWKTKSWYHFVLRGQQNFKNLFVYWVAIHKMLPAFICLDEPLMIFNLILTHLNLKRGYCRLFFFWLYSVLLDPNGYLYMTHTAKKISKFSLIVQPSRSLSGAKLGVWGPHLEHSRSKWLYDVSYVVTT